MPILKYENNSFPLGTVPNGMAQLQVTWGDVLWAALTVGRPGLFHVFRHGLASVHEAVFRVTMVRMALEQRGGHSSEFQRTQLFKEMDPTEKGAVNYFLGMLVCKLFAAKLLDAPWSLRLDVFRNQLDPRVLAGGSRPDMVAQANNTSQWHAFECKGRASPPGNQEKAKAKSQAQRLVSVNGTNCTLQIGAITFFKGDTLAFYWEDPEPDSDDPIKLPETDNAWGSYYGPAVQLIRSREVSARTERPDGISPLTASIEELDVSIEIHPKIAEDLYAGNWQQARECAISLEQQMQANGFQPDGLRVVPGESWTQPLNLP